MSSVSVREVATRAGVSVGTVSNVLNRPEKVAPTTVEKVHRAIDELGYVRNDAARQLRLGRSRSIGLVLLDVANPFFTDLARGAEQAAESSGNAILLGNSDQTAAREARYLDLFEEQRVQGVLISPIGDVDDRVRRLQSRGIPAVLVDRAGDTELCCSVSVDDFAGGRLAAQHLLDTGRRSLAFVGGPMSIRQIVDRLEGARAAASAVPGATLEHIPIEAPTVLAGRAAGQALLTRPPTRRPDAVFAVNDLVAVGILQALILTGNARVPDEISLIGYDDIAFAEAAVVPITSVRQPSELIGRMAVELVLEESAALGASAHHEHRHVVFQPELVERDSTARR